MQPIEKILLLDDDKINNLICTKVIKQCIPDVKLSVFISPLEALNWISNLAAEDFPEILLIDINMPEMSGWDFLNAYYNLPILLRKNTRVFMLSSSIDRGDIEKTAKNDLINGFIHKPLTKERILEIL